MPQLAGCLCTICGKRISGLAEGSFCVKCGNPVHHACAEAVQNNDVSRCSACGTLSPELKEPDRSTRSASPGRILKHLFAFRGQVSRGNYSLHLILDAALLASLFFFAYPFVKAVALRHEITYRINHPEQAYAITAVFVFLLATWSAMAVTVRRLHAIGRPGTHCFLLLVPPYNVYLGLLLLFSPGKDGNDKYRHDATGMRHKRVDLGPGNSLLVVASRHESNGEWDRALELYQRAAEELKGGPHCEFAESRIQRLRRKAAVAQESGSAE